MPPISSQLSYYSKVSWIITKTKQRKLPSPKLCHFLLGCAALVDYRWRDPCSIPDISSLPLHISDPAQLPLAFWTATLRYCSLLHKHSCYNLSLHQGLYQPSNQSQPQAIWCRTSSLNRIEPALLNVTLIVLNCLNSTLLSLFKQYPGLFHVRLIFLLSFVWVVENGVDFVCPFLD